MPVPLRTTYHKAEAKYNVTTEFPALGLHSAAANGNVGLVEYALDHGQPVNSVLDGVLPLHAACAGGNVQVVKLLIEHGADVNAPRLPRRYSNDRNRDTSAPIVGSSGSTPLHFAAANGNTEVVKLLLRHGAHADRPDKHGITPEILAKQNGWIQCADVLRDWLREKDRDLREREGVADDPSNTSARDNTNAFASDPDMASSLPRRRLHMMPSLDSARNMFKSSSSNLAESYKKSQHSSHTPTPPASPHKPLGEYTFYPDGDGSDTPVDAGGRRPSLPHILQPQDDSSTHKQTTSATSSSGSRRPRSAGNGADRTTEQDHGPAIYGRGGAGRKLGSKYSLLNLFKKGQGDDTPSEGDLTSQDSSAPSSSRLWGSTTTLPLSASPSHNDTLGVPKAAEVEIVDTASAYGSSTSCSPFSRTGFRFHRGSDASTRSSFQQSEKASPNLQRNPSSGLRSTGAAISLTPELHNAVVHKQVNRDRSRSTTSNPTNSIIDEDTITQTSSLSSSPLSRLNILRTQGHHRDRSGSASSIVGDSNSPARPPVFLDDEVAVPDHEILRPPARPGILRGHNRSSSNGQVTGPFRALRFDSSSEADPEIQRGSEHLVVLRSSNSAGSLSKVNESGTRPGSAGSGSKGSLYRDFASAPATISDFRQYREDTKGSERDEYEYGQALESQESNNLSDQQSPEALLMRQRGMSFASSQSSLSPIISNDGGAVEPPAILARDFPFSIHRPPSLPLDSARSAVSELEDHNDWNDDSDNNKLSASVAVTAASASHTPSSHSGVNSAGYIGNADPIASSKAAVSRPSAELHSSTHHIDLSSISSHAQAEALVQKAREEALEMANAVQEITMVPNSAGRTPLSAKLAAYGETLALEKRLREQREAQEPQNIAINQKSSEKGALEQPLSGGQPLVSVSDAPRRRRDGVDRQLSLESKPTSERTKRRPGGVRRPSTADGLFGKNDRSFSAGELQTTAACSRSASTSAYPCLSEHTQHILSDASLPCACSENQPIYSEPVDVSDLVEADETVSQTSSMDGISMDTELGPQIGQISSTPHSGATVRGKREQDRSAKKLTRMGLPPNEQGGRAPPTPRRFGAIKSLMQTLKGKP